MKKMIEKQKQRNQVKSKFYYIFWGTATFAVVAGQIYVGTGYRLMSGAMHRIFDAIDIEVNRGYNRDRFY
tara:strand:+ start:768 stop:977 length:210 start_codon:yes stop_codon:yes gene_type:complete